MLSESSNMAVLNKNKFYGLKASLRHSTILSGMALASSLLSIITSNEVYAGTCSGTGADSANTYTCSGTFTGSTPQQYPGSVPSGVNNQFWFKAASDSTTTITANSTDIIGINLQSAYNVGTSTYAETYINFINNGSINTSTLSNVSGTGDIGFFSKGVDILTYGSSFGRNLGTITETTNNIASTGSSVNNWTQGIFSSNVANIIFGTAPTIELINDNVIDLTTGRADTAANSQSWAIGLVGLTKFYNGTNTNNVNVILSNSGTITAASGDASNNNSIASNTAGSVAFGLFGNSVLGRS